MPACDRVQVSVCSYVASQLLARRRSQTATPQVSLNPLATETATVRRMTQATRHLPYASRFITATSANSPTIVPCTQQHFGTCERFFAVNVGCFDEPHQQLGHATVRHGRLLTRTQWAHALAGTVDGQPPQSCGARSRTNSMGQSQIGNCGVHFFYHFICALINFFKHNSVVYWAPIQKWNFLTLA